MRDFLYSSVPCCEFPGHRSTRSPGVGFRSPEMTYRLSRTWFNRSRSLYSSGKFQRLCSHQFSWETPRGRILSSPNHNSFENRTLPRDGPSRGKNSRIRKLFELTEPGARSSSGRLFSEALSIHVHVRITQTAFKRSSV